MGRLKIAPSINRILSMPIPILVGHYALIKLKQSTLSSTQRKRVVARIAYLKDKGKITQEELNKEIEHVAKEFNANADISIRKS